MKVSSLSVTTLNKSRTKKRREKKKEEKKKRRSTTSSQLMTQNKVERVTFTLVMRNLITEERMKSQLPSEFTTHPEEDQTSNSVEQFMNDYFNTVCIF